MYANVVSGDNQASLGCWVCRLLSCAEHHYHYHLHPQCTNLPFSRIEHLSCTCYPSECRQSVSSRVADTGLLPYGTHITCTLCVTAASFIDKASFNVIEVVWRVCNALACIPSMFL